MPELRLEGLNREGFPVAALAAYGLLRVLAEKGVEARLSFDEARGRPVARLHLPSTWGEKEFLDSLEDYVDQLGPERFGLPSGEAKGRYAPKEIRSRLAGGDQASPFLLAYVNPWWEPDGQALRSPLDTTSGQQGFLSFLSDLLNLVKAHPMRPVFRRALFRSVILPPDPLLREEDPGHPLFGDKVPDLKWHPVRKRESADQAELANKERKELTLRISPGALLLALEALPFYPFPPREVPPAAGLCKGEGGQAPAPSPPAYPRAPCGCRAPKDPGCSCATPRGAHFRSCGVGFAAEQGWSQRLPLLPASNAFHVGELRAMSIKNLDQTKDCANPQSPPKPRGVGATPPTLLE